MQKIRHFFQKYRLIACAAIVLSATLCAGYVWYWEYTPKDSLVGVFLSGNIPIVFVRTPHGKLIVIDGGSDARILREINAVIPIHRKTIDTIILSNTTDKRLVGLIPVLERYSVNKLLAASWVSSSTQFNSLDTTLQAKSIEPSIVSAKENIFVDGVGITLWPTEHGLVTKISIGKKSILITADALAKDFGPELIGQIGSTTNIVLSHNNGSYFSEEMFKSFHSESIILKKFTKSKAKALVAKIAPKTFLPIIDVVTTSKKTSTKNKFIKTKSAKKFTKNKSVQVSEPNTKIKSKPEPKSAAKIPFDITKQKDVDIINLTTSSMILFSSDGVLLKRVQ